MSNTRDVLGDDVTFKQIVEGTITSFEDDAIDFLRSYAFARCASLTSISLPACTSVGESAFSGCGSLTSIDLPSCTYVGSNAFFECFSLTSVSLPVCTSIRSSTFAYCKLLVSLYLTSVSAVTNIRSNTFTSTPIGGYSVSAGQYGSVYVPASLYSDFIVANYWSDISARIVSVA